MDNQTFGMPSNTHYLPNERFVEDYDIRDVLNREFSDIDYETSVIRETIFADLESNSDTFRVSDDTWYSINTYLLQVIGSHASPTTDLELNMDEIINILNSQSDSIFVYFQKLATYYGLSIEEFKKLIYNKAIQYKDDGFFIWRFYFEFALIIVNSQEQQA